MTTENTSRVQETKSIWRKIVDDQVARTEVAYVEMTRLQDQMIAQNKVAVDELAKLTKTSVDYVMELTGEWRKLTLEATRKMTDFTSLKG